MGGPVAIRVGNTEWPKWTTVMSADPVDADVLAAQARNAPLTRPRPGPRRPGRHAEVRPRRRPAGPRARQRPRDGGPGRARRGRQGVPAAGARRGGAQPRRRHRLGARAGRRACRGPATTTPSTRPRCAASIAETSAAMIAEIDATKKAGDTLGGVVEVRRVGPAAGPGQPRARRPAPRLAAGRRADGHPGDQGRRGRRRLRAGPAPRLAGARRDRPHATARSAGSPAARAAPRAA